MAPAGGGGGGGGGQHGQHGGGGGGGSGPHGVARGGHGQFHGQSWGNSHHGWGQRTVWAHNHNWWRGRRGWEGYRGIRVGFFFAPGWGYYEIPHEYWGHRWYVGEYLPPFFWRYIINDYWNYGLEPPPPGCAWVWLNGNIALIDLGDGYIIDMAYDVW
jgi:Ni/Co efflux regulator RcnB